MDGFYLTTIGQCKRNPVSPIPDCIVYNSSIACSECRNGFHLPSSQSCIENGTFVNCELFDGTATSTTCLKCTNEYYLNGSCIQRTNIDIEFCEIYSIFNDNCQ